MYLKGGFMTLTLLDLYNAAATQEWSMYDNEAMSDNEFEQSLVLALNKAVQEILYSYPFKFRECTHVILTTSGEASYEIPKGIINMDGAGNYCVKINSKYLKLADNSKTLESKTGVPEMFYTTGDKIIFYPTPQEKFMVTIEYTTLAIGTNIENEEIFILKNDDDTISVPEHLEELLKNAVVSRAMLNSIASESDENYSAYKKQSETAYRLLIKYSKGVGVDKSVKF